MIQFYPLENQRIESRPEGRFLSLSFARQMATVGDVRLLYSVLYIPAGHVDPEQAKADVLNVSGKSFLHLPEGKTEDIVKVPIRNDAFLQNGAHFLVQVHIYTYIL